MPDSPDNARRLLQAAGHVERRDAELLLAAAWSLTRSQLLAREMDPVPAGVAARFAQQVEQRAAGVPVAYLLGHREFWSLPFEVTPAVLVPRPETELLVERVLHLVTAHAAEVADLGTGSGAIAVSLAHERPSWRVLGTDASADALAVARRNGEKHAGGRVEWRAGDWYAPLAGRRFDAIASNPPYIAESDPALASDGVRHEPRVALTPGSDGMSALRTLINGAPGHLEPGGWLVLEHGADQGAAVRAALVARGFAHVTSHTDLAGHDRVTEGNLPHARF
ncbi:MAG TPA: peptide chain release factor N(5)-glutamine methyltransferase [Steroidobacteraceae bacterium]|jgi:release factor glutamine methyltransferase|nr:peptide chain release factor N(5)-glutamine methyltransferase [Steroidobacteraceae bacterium]